MLLRTIPPRFSSAQKPCLAFTLVELLVVIAILAVLIALAFPALSQAINSSQKAANKSNLHQLTSAILSHASENGNNLVASVPGGPGGVTWSQSTMSEYLFGKSVEYAMLDDIFLSPGAVDNQDIVFGGQPDKKCWGYGRNAHLGMSEVYEQTTTEATPLARINRPTEAMLLCDFAVPNFNKWQVSQEPKRRNMEARYQGKVFVAFVDGHVESLPFAEFKTRINDTHDIGRAFLNGQ